MQRSKFERLIVRSLSILMIVTGAILIVWASGQSLSGYWQVVVQGIGIALFPTGVISLLADRYLISHIIDAVMVEVGESISAGIEAMLDALENTTTHLESTLNSKMEETIAGLRAELELLQKAHKLGISTVFRSRLEALQRFSKYLREEQNRIVIVGSSLLGLMRFIDEQGRTAKEILEERLLAGCDVKLLLTHPSYSHFREGQEGRMKGQIAREIEETLFVLLEHMSFLPENIKFYKGTPTCFLIITPERMLVNPYPYETEAYNSYCLEVENKGRSSIYHHYHEFHFQRPWKGGNSVPFSEFEGNRRAFEALKQKVRNSRDPLLQAFFDRLFPEPAACSGLFLYGVVNVLVERGLVERVPGGGQNGRYSVFRDRAASEEFYVENPGLDGEAEAQLVKVMKLLLEDGRR